MLVIIFWHFLIIQLTSESPQIKRYLISSIMNLAHELPHELPNDLSLRILENQEILEKCQMWVQTQPNVQSSFQKLNVENSCQKTHKTRYYIFEVLPNFIVSLYFVPNILSRIVLSLLVKNCHYTFSWYASQIVVVFYSKPTIKLLIKLSLIYRCAV